jgi:hypothetical protein
VHAPAIGDPQAGDAQGKPEAKPVKYCQMATFTGSRIPQKICKTRQEWIDQTGVDPETLRR